MMLMGDKKKMATVILGNMMKDKKPDFVEEIGGVKKEEINPEKPMKEYDTGFMSAAEDLLKAIEEKDVKAVSNALKAHYDMCMVEESED